MRNGLWKKRVALRGIKQVLACFRKRTPLATPLPYSVERLYQHAWLVGKDACELGQCIAGVLELNKGMNYLHTKAIFV